MACRLGSCITIGCNVLWDNGSIPSHDLSNCFLCIAICSHDFNFYFEFYGSVEIDCV